MRITTKVLQTRSPFFSLTIHGVLCRIAGLVCQNVSGLLILRVLSVTLADGLFALLIFILSSITTQKLEQRRLQQAHNFHGFS